MGRIFLWFYCLDIPDALLLVAFGTLGYLLARKQWGKTAWWRFSVTGLFLLWIGLILLGTLADRSVGEFAPPRLEPFHSYRLAAEGNRELYRVNFMNAVLFYPAGLMGLDTLPRRRNVRIRRVLLLTGLLLLSIGIEYCQFRFSLGLVEIDDVIHNWLGGLAGILISQIDNKKPA